jgi:wobble nucleotide-excising tRNase
MQIDRIKRLQETGIFREFIWPSSLQDFGRYNLIYGWNGTGKSTLARIFSCLQSRTIPEGTVALVVDGNEVMGDTFAGTPVPIRVFNREFVEKNVLSSTQAAHDSPEVPALFVIGEKNVESQKRADAKREELRQLQQRLLLQVSARSDASAAMDTYCTDQAKLIKELLRGQGSAYNNYNKATFRAKAEHLLQQDDASKVPLSDAARAERINKHQSTPREKLIPIGYTFPELARTYEDVRALLSRVVTSEVLESLKKDPDVASWVKAGLEKHQQRKAANCLFCDQGLPAARLEALNAHFNDAYQRLLLDVASRINRVDFLVAELSGLLIPKSTETYDHLIAKHKSAAEELDAELAKLKSGLAFVRRQLVEKRNVPFEGRSFDDKAVHLDVDAIKRLNDVIAEHNKHSDEFAKEVRKAREELEASQVAASLTLFNTRQKALDDAAISARQTEEKIRRLDAEIAQLD